LYYKSRWGGEEFEEFEVGGLVLWKNAKVNGLEAMVGFKIKII
jgi:hypothetical protein